MLVRPRGSNPRPHPARSPALHRLKDGRACFCFRVSLIISIIISGIIGPTLSFQLVPFIFTVACQTTVVRAAGLLSVGYGRIWLVSWWGRCQCWTVSIATENNMIKPVITLSRSARFVHCYLHSRRPRGRQWGRGKV